MVSPSLKAYVTSVYDARHFLPVAWAAWLTKGIRDEPESGGGLMVGAIQLAIMLGAAFGGLLLDHLSVAATFLGGTVLLVFSSLTVGKGDRLRPPIEGEPRVCPVRG